MWRAHVIERIQAGEVTVTIPALFRDSPVGPIRSAVDAQVGDEVIVVDLARDAKVRSWWVLGFSSTIGRWGNPYPHTHPIGQVTAVTDTGEETTLPAILDTKADTADLAAYVTDTDLSTTLTGYATTASLADYATTTALTNGLATKANAPGAWVMVTPTTYLALDTGPALAVRRTSEGIQLRGRYQFTSAVPADATMFTLGTDYRPLDKIIFNCAGMTAAPNYTPATYQFDLRPDGRVLGRGGIATGGWVQFNTTLIF